MLFASTAAATREAQSKIPSSRRQGIGRRRSKPVPVQVVPGQSLVLSRYPADFFQLLEKSAPPSASLVEVSIEVARDQAVLFEGMIASAPRR